MSVMIPLTAPIIAHSTIHQPLLPMSCSRRTATAQVGRIMARTNNDSTSDMVPAASGTRKAIAPRMTMEAVIASSHHQYSARVARPLKAAYLRRHCSDGLRERHHRPGIRLRHN